MEQQILQSLKESKAWYESGKLTEATSALKRAEGLVATDRGSGAKLQEQVGQWQSDLETVNRLEQIRFYQATPPDKRHVAGALKSDNVPARNWSENEDGNQDAHWDSDSANRSYAKEFEKYGITPDAADVEKSATIIRNSPIKQELVAALDEWCQVIEHAGNSSVKESTNTNLGSGKETLLQIARLADPDPWRDRLRDAILHDNPLVLSKLASEADVLAQPPPTILLLTRALEARDADSNQALDLLRKAQLLHANDFWISVELANCLPTGSEAELAFRRLAVALRPDSPGARDRLIFCLLYAGNYADVEAVSRESIRQNPNDFPAYRYLAFVLSDLGHDAEAEATLREVIHLNLTYAAAHASLGNILRDCHRDAEAELAYREAIRLSPNYFWAYNDLGWALLNQGKYAEAEAAWRECIRIDPNHYLGPQNLGWALVKQKKYADAEAAFREALRLYPKSSWAESRLSNLLISEGKWQETEIVARAASVSIRIMNLPEKTSPKYW